MPHTLLNKPQGYGQVQTIITREHGITSLALLEDQTVEVWTENGWEAGTVACVGTSIVSPTCYHLARPSGLSGLEGKDDMKWARRGTRQVLMFVTDHMPAMLAEGRMLNPMLYNRTLPCSAPIPNIFTEDYKDGQAAARKALTDQREQAGAILGKPTSSDYVFGVVMELTRHRARSKDETRRVLYLKRRDIIDWVAQNSVLGGYIMTTQQPPKIILDPANHTIGWKHSGTMNPPTEMKVYQVEGVRTGMMTLGNGIYVMSEEHE